MHVTLVMDIDFILHRYKIIMQVLYEPSIRSLTLKDVNDNEMSSFDFPKGIRFLYIESGELQKITVPEDVIE